jgi:hypothetical protein
MLHQLCVRVQSRLYKSVFHSVHVVKVFNRTKYRGISVVLGLSRMIFFVISIVLLLVANVQSEQTPGAGAVYTMTNGAVMNEILVYQMDSTGQLKWVRTVDTKGVGLNTTAGDPLASQGALSVHSNYLFAVNPGSNSLSMFSINPSDATELTFLSVQPTFGSFPISVTVNSKYACVLTGGSMSAIRCYTYGPSGLSIVPSFDRDLSPHISQRVPPVVRRGRLSQIQFAGDDRALIISVKSHNKTINGFLLFYPLTEDFSQLASTPIRQTPPHAIDPFSMTLVQSNGLLITDPGARGVLTLTYSSIDGSISSNTFTPVDEKTAGALCWSTYSPATGNYYVIGAGPAAIVEFDVDMTHTKIVRYYPLPKQTGALDATIVSLDGIDHLYVLGIQAQVISVYQLNGVGNGAVDGVFPRPERNMAGLPKIVGIAAFVHKFE